MKDDREIRCVECGERGGESDLRNRKRRLYLGVCYALSEVRMW